MSTPSTSVTQRYTIVVVGAGLAGLSTAYQLARRLEASPLPSMAHEYTIQVLEARDRVGGRTLTASPALENTDVDLGASWIWPSQNPCLTRLAKSLDLSLIPEHDGQAYRFVSGSQAIAKQLEITLSRDPRVTLHLGREVTALRRLSKNSNTDSCTSAGGCQKSELVEVLFRTAKDDGGHEDATLEADVVFMAMPPRLILDLVRFEPSLGQQAGLVDAMASCRTWMAQQGKFAAEYTEPFWRTNGRLPARSTPLYWAQLRGDGPLDVIFENGRVIWGFMANSRRWRSLSREERSPHILKQLAAVLGAEALDPERTAEQDWAKERLTCSQADAREEEPWSHPPYSNQEVWTEGHWEGLLWFAGSETAAGGGAGFLEGAVSSAEQRVGQWMATM